MTSIPVHRSNARAATSSTSSTSKATSTTTTPPSGPTTTSTPPATETSTLLDQTLAGASRDAGPRLSSTNTGRTPAWQLVRGDAGLTPGLSGAARALLHQIGVKPDDLPRLLAGETVLFTQPTASGDDTIGTVRVKGERIDATIISVHDVGGGVKALLGFREQARDLGRAMGCRELVLGGAAVINQKLEEKLQRLGFAPGQAPVPDELGNVDDMMVYTRTFTLDGGDA